MKLQEDIYNDTQKYFRIFNTPREETLDPIMLRYKEMRGRSEYLVEKRDYWYRLYNDGYTPIDGLHYQNHWENYKAWMEELEDKALDTLKMAVDMLLIKAREDKVTHDSTNKTKTDQLE